MRSVPGSYRQGLNLRAAGAPADVFAPHSMQEGILSNALALLDDEDGDEFYLAPMSPAGGAAPADASASASSWKQRTPISLGRKPAAERDERRSAPAPADPPSPAAAAPPAVPTNRSGSSLTSLTSSPKQSPSLPRKSTATSAASSSSSSPQKTTKNLFLKSAKAASTLKNILSGQSASVSPKTPNKNAEARSGSDVSTSALDMGALAATDGDPKREAEAKRSSPGRNIFGSVRKKPFFGATDEDMSVQSLSAQEYGDERDK